MCRDFGSKSPICKVDIDDREIEIVAFGGLDCLSNCARDPTHAVAVNLQRFLKHVGYSQIVFHDQYI
jgi:hypothetical protein